METPSPFTIGAHYVSSTYYMKNLLHILSPLVGGRGTLNPNYHAARRGQTCENEGGSRLEIMCLESEQGFEQFARLRYQLAASPKGQADVVITEQQ